MHCVENQAALQQTATEVLTWLQLQLCRSSSGWEPQRNAIKAVTQPTMSMLNVQITSYYAATRLLQPKCVKHRQCLLNVETSGLQDI